MDVSNLKIRVHLNWWVVSTGMRPDNLTKNVLGSIQEAWQKSTGGFTFTGAVDLPPQVD